MNASRQVHPLEMLTAALGGRRVYAFLWALWLFAAVVGHYAQEMTRGENVRWSSKITFAICVIAFVLYAFLLLRGLVSKERRGDLLLMRSNLAPASPSLRILVWTVPILALGAVLAPVFIK